MFQLIVTDTRKNDKARPRGLRQLSFIFRLTILLRRAILCTVNQTRLKSLRKVVLYMQSRSQTTRMLAAAALFAAMTAICSQIQIPLPMVPINLALFAVHLCGALLGAKWGALSMAAYALLGAVGVPVFSGFAAGPAVLFGKTGGYILGYILCAALVGVLSRRPGFTFGKLCIAMVIGVAVCYLFGTVWFMVLTGMDLMTSLTYCVIPFLPGDAVKIVLAALLTIRLRKPLAQLGMAA